MVIVALVVVLWTALASVVGLMFGQVTRRPCGPSNGEGESLFREHRARLN